MSGITSTPAATPGCTPGHVGAGTSATITGLTTGVTYSVQVRAENDAGEGPWSNSATGTPGIRPGKPDRPTVARVAGSETSLSASWTAPANDGTAITDYDVRYHVNASSDPWLYAGHVGAGTSATLAGLTTGVTYSV